MLGADGAGLFFLALTSVTMATVLSRLGMDSTIMRFVAASAASEDWGSVRGALREALLVTAASLVLTLALFLGAGPIGRGVFSKPDLIGPLALMSLAIVPMSLSLVQAEALKGIGWVRAACSSRAFFHGRSLRACCIRSPERGVWPAQPRLS